MTDARPHVRTYTAPRGVKAGIATVLATTAGLFALYPVLLDTATDFGTALFFGLPAGALLFMIVVTLRAATIVGQSGITIRMARLRKAAWRDIVAIEVEPYDDGQGRTRDQLVIYTRDARRTPLPYVTETHGPLQTSARTIREIWERQRGEDWLPLPTAVATGRGKATQRQKSADKAVTALRLLNALVQITLYGILVTATIMELTG
ncbi:hypothetical protein SRB5_45360 [Streptomyces sp. RB5]|uniref:PH domain-containing protein n=1 Tax=Streptomyces smaragdinus TaxID=2585196 RepID=A0A7K0CLL3_9ACTN|nr:hypothetical protein [Streptomyces smaragdinus]MQY14370.1 hypothetical protein [Streptomyces smaragdinus]